MIWTVEPKLLPNHQASISLELPLDAGGQRECSRNSFGFSSVTLFKGISASFFSNS